MNKRLSKNFTLNEFTVTKTGLQNIPDSVSQANIENAVNIFFQPLRDSLGKPIIINSGYRSKEVNSAVGGVKNSYHLTGRAFDFYVKGLTSKQVETEIYKTGLSKRLRFLQVHSNYIHAEI